jgi:hypothetical protein
MQKNLDLPKHILNLVNVIHVLFYEKQALAVTLYDEQQRRSISSIGFTVYFYK